MYMYRIYQPLTLTDTNVEALPYPSNNISFVVHYEINKRDMANRLISSRPGVRSIYSI